MDTGRPCAQIGHHQKRSELLGAGTFHTITGLSGGLGNSVSVSTDYLLGIEHSAIVDVSGLNDKDVAVLAELADRLRNRNH